MCEESSEIECSICFDFIDKKEMYKLNCNHCLHNSCYNNFLKSPALKKCPMCRTDIFKDMNLCQICKKEMNIDPTACEVIQSNTCGCLFHYKCLKSQKTFFCERCYNIADIENSDALSYLYFATGHMEWIGKIPICLHPNCTNIGYPNHFGYCDTHSKNVSSNKAIILSFIYFIRYVDTSDQDERNKIFIDLVDYMDKNHKYNSPEEVDFPTLRKIIGIS